MGIPIIANIRNGSEHFVLSECHSARFPKLGFDPPLGCALNIGLETVKLTADKENVLNPVESETKPQVQIYSQVGNHASVHTEWQTKRNSTAPEWFRFNDECRPQKALEKDVPLQADERNGKCIESYQYSILIDWKLNWATHACFMCVGWHAVSLPWLIRSQGVARIGAAEAGDGL